MIQKPDSNKKAVLIALFFRQTPIYGLPSFFWQEGLATRASYTVPTSNEQIHEYTYSTVDVMGTEQW